MSTTTHTAMDVEEEAPSLDMVFLIDTTGSMGSWMQAAKEKILAIHDLVLKDLQVLTGSETGTSKTVILRTGVISYKDFQPNGELDTDQLQLLDLTTDVNKTRQFLMSLTPSGGHDSPEDVAGGVEMAINQVSWKGRHKLLIHIADAPAHGKEYCDGHDSFPSGHKDRKDLKVSIEALATMGIDYTLLQITGQTKKMSDVFKKVYRDFAMKNLKSSVKVRKPVYRELVINQNTTEFFSFILQSVRGTLSDAGITITLETTGSPTLDLFNKTVRAVPEEYLVTLLESAWKENPLETLKIVFYTRDVRGGKGERLVFHQAIKWLIQNHSEHVIANLENFAEYGRWEDLLHYVDSANTAISKAVVTLFANQLKEDFANMNSAKAVSLCAKWAPTEGRKHDKKCHAVSKIAAALGCNKKEYRKKYLSPLREYIKVVERLMCLGKWKSIDYNSVPSVAMKKLKKAFEKKDTERFNEWKAKLQKGEAKVNAAALHPHELVAKYMQGGAEDVVTEEQWKVIVKETAKLGLVNKALVLSDVSDSMKGEPMQASIALGILISELAQPPFNNTVITFEDNPQFHQLPTGSLFNRVKSLQSAPWGGSTDFQAVFDMILEKAAKVKMPPEAMPDKIFVISDMQFNLAGRKTNFQMLKDKYKSFGYHLPKLIFWNVKGDSDDFTNSATDENVALVSGFSASILKAVLAGRDFSPIAIMKQAIDDKRYEKIKLAAATSSTTTSS